MRPTLNDPAVCAAAAASLMTRIVACDGFDMNEEDGAEDLASALEEAENAFRVAKELYDLGWTISDDVMEVLLDHDAALAEAHQKLVKAWVKEDGIVCRFAVGATVRCNVDGTEHVGEVTRVDADMAQCLVCVAALGHVREGIGTNGYNFNDEDLEAAC
jgi:hypothetical protein